MRLSYLPLIPQSSLSNPSLPSPSLSSADGDEGGRHQLIGATVGSDNKLYIIKIQIGDKRWFKGAKKEAMGAFDSFTVV